MSFVVTGATGRLGRLIVEDLLAHGVAPESLVATGREVDRISDLAERGVRTAHVDYDDPGSMVHPFAGADVLMLVSATQVGQRVEQHRNAIEAATAAGVQQVVYTSAPKADQAPLILAPEHKATEELIHASGLDFTILRNNWYTENYLPALEQARLSGEVVSSAGRGRVASATRADFAAAASVVLRTDGHTGRIYELAGDQPWDFDELAQAIGEVIGREVAHRRVTPDEHFRQLVGAGVPEPTAQFLVALDADIHDGHLAGGTTDLSELIGRPTTPLVEGLRAAAAEA